jgi:RNA polymerase sigma factor (sigma-70 family)
MKELIQNAQRGDWDAVCAIVDTLRERLTRMADFYAARCGEDAGDLLQESWLGALEALQDVDVSIGDPQQYLIKHAKWRMLDYIKWNRRRTHDSLDEIALDLPFVDHDAFTSAYTSQFLEQLNHKQQTLVRLLYDGNTWREAGVKLGCTSANVAYHVRQIQRAFAKWAEDEALVTSAR